MLLVGDSVGTVIAAKEDDNYVTLDEMIYHTKAVAKAAEISNGCRRYAFHDLSH